MKGWKILMKGLRMKVKVIDNRGKKRKMKKMNNGTLMDSNLFKFSPVPGNKLQSFFFPLVLSLPVFEVSFLSFTQRFSPYLGGNVPWAKYTGKRISASFCSKFIFIPSYLDKNFMESTLPRCGKKRRTFSFFSSAGSRRVLGHYVVVHRVLVFFLSLYIGLRDYTVSLCEYRQHLPTCIWLSV